MRVHKGVQWFPISTPMIMLYVSMCTPVIACLWHDFTCQSKHPHELPQNMHYVITYVTEMREHVPCTCLPSCLFPLSLFLCPSSPHPPGTSGFFRRTGLPAGDHVLRVVAVDPVRNERAVIRNRIRVREASTFCVVVGTNAGLTVGRNNNVTVEFTGIGLTTGFQCLMDRQEPYFHCKCSGLAQFMPHLVSVANRAHSNSVPGTKSEHYTLIDQQCKFVMLLG